jgi:hypothetical protein
MEEIITSIARGTQLEEAVVRTMGLPKGQQEALVEAIGGIKSENAARFLSLLYPRLSDKSLQKLVKRALFRLKTQGIRVEEPRAPGESVLKKVEASREARAFLSNYDNEQTRVAIVAFEMKKNQFLFSHAIVRFSHGLVELKSLPVARADLEGILGDYFARTRPPMVLPQVSAPYAAYVVEEASNLSGKEIEEARSLHHIVGAVKDHVRRPDDIYLLAADTAVAPSWESVLAHEIFQPFVLDWPGMEEDRKRLDDVVNPAIVLPPYVVEERRQTFLSDLAENERVAPKLAPFRRMLEDYAYLLYSLKDFDNYKGLVDQLRDQAAVRKAFLHFVMKAFEKREAKEDRPQPGVIVDPYSLGRK